MSDLLRSMLIGTTGLWTLLGVAVWITVSRGRLAGGTDLRRRVSRAALAAIGGHAAHFTEEPATGFYVRFPERLGLEPWPVSFFVALNLAWLAIWTVAVWRLRAGRLAALAVLWFLAIASLANVVAHPLLSLDARRYFPGLVTAPLVGLAGAVLASRLVAATRSAAPRVRSRSGRRRVPKT